MEAIIFFARPEVPAASTPRPCGIRTRAAASKAESPELPIIRTVPCCIFITSSWAETPFELIYMHIPRQKSRPSPLAFSRGPAEKYVDHL
jgi:hypothetical protein